MRKLVLLIDDDDAFRKGVAGVLKQARYDVLEAADGQQALAVIEQLHGGIDLLVVDLCIPEVNGFEVIGAVTRHPSHIKILATSAVYKDLYLEIAGTLGATETIRKQPVGEPLNGNPWLSAVERLIGPAADSQTPTS
jgi:CheY-like chemotaxis protein